MKILVSVIMSMIFSIGMISAQSSVKVNPSGQESMQDAKEIKVVYFHFSRRCATCIAVEEVSKATLEELYPGQMKDGTVKFITVDLDDEEGMKTGEEYEVNSQSLIIFSGDKKTDLTTKGFMYARTKPEKLKKVLKMSIDKLLE